MKTSLLLIAILFTLSIASAQAPRDSVIVYNNQLKISALRVIDPFNPGIDISYEREYAKMFSSQLSFTYITNIVNFLSDDFRIRGYRLAFEEKFFFHQKKRVRFYIGVEAAYGRNFSTQTVRYQPAGDTSNYVRGVGYLDTVTFHRQTVTGNVKFGIQILVKHLVFDISAGFGIKYIDARISGKLVPGDAPVTAVDLNINSFYLQEGKRVVPNIPMNVRIGVTF